jgi:CARDB
MKRTTLLLALLGSGLAVSVFMMSGAAAAPPQARPFPAFTPTLPKPGPTALAPRPDLAITNFSLSSWGGCKPGLPIFTLNVVVKNQGNGSWSGAAPTVSVKDLHPGVSWGVTAAIDPPLAAGASRDFKIAIMYKNPTHMMHDQPHPFQAVVNPDHVVYESNFANNSGNGPAVWNGVRGVILMGLPQSCEKVEPGPAPKAR